MNLEFEPAVGSLATCVGARDKILNLKYEPAAGSLATCRIQR